MSAMLIEEHQDLTETLVPYEWDISCIEPSVWEMISVLNSTDIPSPNPSCENCAYAQQRAIAEI